MTTRDERYLDLLTELSDAQARHIVDALQAACAAPAAPAQLRVSVARALDEQATTHRPRQWFWLAPRRILALAAALLVIVGGRATYLLSNQSPTPVSAQAVLGYAVSASRLGANEIAHVTYTFLQGMGFGGTTGPMEVWLQADARGKTRHFTSTQTVYRRDGTVAAIRRMVVNGHAGQQYAYDPTAHAVAVQPATLQQLGPGGLNVFDAPSVAAYIAQVAHRQSGQIHLLPEQQLDDVTVYVLRLDAARALDSPATIFYVAMPAATCSEGQTSNLPRPRPRPRCGCGSRPTPRSRPQTCAHTFDLHVPRTAHHVDHVQVPEFMSNDNPWGVHTATDLHLLEPMKVLP